MYVLNSKTTTKHNLHENLAEEEEDIVIEEDAHMDAALGKVDIGFEGFQLTLAQKKGKADRVILDGSLKGVAKSGRMLAVMGPSGSGTLLVGVWVESSRIPKKSYHTF